MHKGSLGMCGPIVYTVMLVHRARAKRDKSLSLDHGESFKRESLDFRKLVT